MTFKIEKGVPVPEATAPMKQCTQCRKMLPTTDYYARGGTDRLQAACKSCVKQRVIHARHRHDKERVKMRTLAEYTQRATATGDEPTPEIIDRRTSLMADVERLTSIIRDLDRQIRAATYERNLRTRALNRLGAKHSDETKAKISAARKGKATKHQSDEFREACRERQTGRKASDEARANMASAQKAAWQRRRGMHAQDPLEAAIFGGRS